MIIRTFETIDRRIKENARTLFQWHFKGWFTLATESEAESESEAHGALRSSVNQKAES